MMEPGSGGTMRAIDLVALNLIEQLCSRLCHDLAGPVGAIRNGLELIDEAGEGNDGGTREALGLIGHSADQAARRLRLFRLAYGRSTRDNVRGFAEVREAALDWLVGGRLTLQWPHGQPDDVLATRPGLARVLLNLVMLAAEASPHGGTLAVTAGGTIENGWVKVVTNGRGIKWSAELDQVLTGALAADELGPRTIHAGITGRFTSGYGMSLTAEYENGGALTFALSW